MTTASDRRVPRSARLFADGPLYDYYIEGVRYVSLPSAARAVRDTLDCTLSEAIQYCKSLPEVDE